MTDTTTPTPNAAATAPPDRIECRATKDPAVRLFILAAMLIGFGIYCGATATRYVPFAWKDINPYLSWLLGAYGPYVLIPPGVLVAVLAIVGLGKRFAADAEGLGYVGKEKIAWSAIAAVDATRLKSKGLLFIHYGQGGRLKLCDWKLTDFKPMVAFLEAHLPAGVTVKTE
jgi:hypothetical protein